MVSLREEYGGGTAVGMHARGKEMNFETRFMYCWSANFAPTKVAHTHYDP